MQQVAVGRVDLDSVGTRGYRRGCGVTELVDDLCELVARDLPRLQRLLHPVGGDDVLLG